MNYSYDAYTGKRTAVPTTRDTFSRLGLSIVLLTLGMTVAQYAISFLFLLAFPAAASAWWANWVVSFVPLYGIGLPMMYLVLQKLPPAPHNAVCDNGFISYEKPAFTAKNWFTVLFMGFGCMYIGGMVGNLCMSLLSAVTGYSYTSALETMVDTSPLWMTLLGTCVIAPLGEEFIFRKLFIDRARRFGDAPAILLSGLLFGLFHGNLFQFFYAAMLGILLAYVYTRTNNLWLCVGMHATINLMGGTVIPALGELIPADPEAELTTLQALISLAVAVWAYGTMIAAAVLFVKRNKWRVLSPCPDRRSTRTVMGDAIAVPAMLAAVILSVFAMIVDLALPVIQMYLLKLQQIA